MGQLEATLIRHGKQVDLVLDTVESLWIGLCGYC